MKNISNKIAVSFLFLIIALILHADSYKHDSTEWMKIVIKEVFISRQTSIDHRDSNSAPEFGWHVRNNGFFARGGSLYATVYIPFPAKESVRLILVERDVFSDDIVSGVNLKPGVSKYKLNNNNDFVILKRTPFFPDIKSGKNITAKGASVTAKDFSDSVSFLGGDYTDYFMLPSGPVAILVVSETAIGYIDSPGEYNVKIYPRKRSMTDVHIVSSTQGNNPVRIRGKIGLGSINYTVLISQGKDTFKKLFNKAMRYMEEEEHGSSYFTQKDFARAFLEYNKIKTIKMCEDGNGYKNKDRFIKFCKIVNNKKR